MRLNHAVAESEDLLNRHVIVQRYSGDVFGGDFDFNLADVTPDTLDIYHDNHPIRPMRLDTRRCVEDHHPTPAGFHHGRVELR
jgi:hypothetical protein